MSFGSRRTRLFRRRYQRGQAMLLVVLGIFGLVTALVVYAMTDTTSLALRRDQNTAAVFAEVKRALIGWSVQRDPSLHGSNARPGELPCPDMNNDGFEDGSCAAGALGRVPWKTLGIPEPKDSAGETLWYSVAGPFRIWNMNNTIIDNDTKGNVTVYQDSTAVAITTQAVAVIFAPGAVVGAQDRGCTVGVNCTVEGQCTTAPASLTPKCNPANYLETAATVNNATTNGPFISASASDTFNDKAMAITTAELMPVVEQRVAREMLRLLSDPITGYRANSVCGCYPWAANNFDDDSVTGRTQGMVPIEVALPEAWGSGTIPSVPPWMIGGNEWGKKFYYAIAPSESQDHTVGSITVNGVSKNLVLITTGPAGASRPSTILTDYVDDAENSDGGTIYMTPSSTAYARDRLYTFP